MRTLKQLLLTPVCICCGSFFCGPALYCNICYDLLIVGKLCAQSGCNPQLKSRHLYLFEWSSGDADEFSQLVYRLKSSNSETAVRHYGGLLALKMQEQWQLNEFTAVVPVPSSNASSVHAHILAWYLAKILKLPFLDLLTKVGPVDQKRLSAAERGLASNVTISARSNEEFTGAFQGAEKYIVVDDVLTTGHSFKQSSAALGGHAGNVIATLFYRTKTATTVS